jgi:hypothetical protein
MTIIMVINPESTDPPDLNHSHTVSAWLSRSRLRYMQILLFLAIFFLLHNTRVEPEEEEV